MNINKISDLKDDEKKRIEGIIEGIDKEKFSSEDMMYLIFSLLDNEFKTPRSQRETNKRIKIFAKIIDKIIEDHFNPQTAITIIGTLGENLLKRNPDLENREDDGYIF